MIIIYYPISAFCHIKKEEMENDSMKDHYLIIQLLCGKNPILCGDEIFHVFLTHHITREKQREKKKFNIKLKLCGRMESGCVEGISKKLVKFLSFDFWLTRKLEFLKKFRFFFWNLSFRKFLIFNGFFSNTCCSAIYVKSKQTNNKTRHLWKIIWNKSHKHFWAFWRIILPYVEGKYLNSLKVEGLWNLNGTQAKFIDSSEFTWGSKGFSQWSLKIEMKLSRNLQNFSIVCL